MQRRSEYTMAIRAYTYWKSISKFLLPFDQYESWTLFIVEEGTFQYSIEGISGQASAGEIVICPPHTAFHREIANGTLTFHFILFNWRETHSQIDQEIRTMLSSLSLHKFSIKESDRLASTLNHLRKTDRVRFTENVAKLREHFLNDIWLLYYLEVQRGSRKVKEDAAMAEVKRLIEESAFNRFYLTDIAQQFHLNKVHLTRRFRQCFGITPMNYLIELRVKKAKTLLAAPDITVEFIAQACGYENAFYFSRVFAKHVGMTPSDFRKLHMV